MASRVASRLLLVVALIVTAHLLKPISGLSIVEQIFSATESLSFVLPDFAEVRIAQASYLATAFGQSVLRDESSRDQAWTQKAFVFPANFAFELPAEPKPRTSARPAARRVGARLAAAGSKSGTKLLIPELPAAMPLERALALSLPQPEFELVLMPLNRLNRRYVQVGRVAERVTVKPLLVSQLAVKKSDCNPAVKTVIATAEEQDSGPQETTEAESWEDFMLDEAVPMESMIFDVEPGPAAPPSRPQCEMPAVPEMILPLQIDFLPKF